MEKKNPIPQGKYVPATRRGDLIFTAGMTPRKDGVLILSEKVSSEKPMEFYREALSQAADNALTAAQNKLEDGECIGQMLQLTVYVNAEDSFTAHSKIADLVVDYIWDQLGEAGMAARTAVGVASLPGNAPAEVQMICAAEKK